MVVNLWCSEFDSRFGVSSVYWCCLLDLMNFDSLNMFLCNIWCKMIWRTSSFFLFLVNFVFPPLDLMTGFSVFFFSASPFSWHLKKEGLFLHVKSSFPPQEMAWNHQKRPAIQLKKHWFWKGMMWILLWIAGEMECLLTCLWAHAHHGF